MAFQNVGFEEADSSDPGNALGWIYTFLAQAQLLADIDPAPDRPQEDFERNWGLDAAQVVNWDITGALDGPYEIVVNSNTALVNAVALTSTQIRDQLLALLQAFIDPITYVAGGGDSIDATADIAGEGFNFAHRQFVNFDITGGTDGTYEITINGQVHQVIASGLTATQIRDAMIVELLGSNFDITFQAGAAGDSIDAIADVVGEYFTHSTSSTGDPIVTVVAINETLVTPNGFFRLLFEDDDLTSPLYDAIDVPPGELGVEDFEEGWTTNQGYLFNLINTFVASYDFVPENVDDFEDEWSNNQVQQVTFTVTGNTDGIYTININTFPHQFTASGNSIEDIRDGLLVELVAASLALDITFVASGTDEIVATANETGVPFIHSTSGPDPITETVDQANATYLFSYEGLPTHLPAQLVAAVYDGEAFEDFEESWDSNETYIFTLPAVTAAIYDTEALGPEAVEDFEEVFADQLFTISTGSPGKIDATAHNLGNNNKVSFRSEGLLPGDLSPNLTYFVRSPTANDFEVAKVSLGISIDILDVGFGPHFIVHNKFAWWTLLMETI